MIDKQKHAQLKRVLEQARFEVKGDAVIQIASLFSWYDSLVKEKPEMKIEPIENPVDKNANK